MKDLHSDSSTGLRILRRKEVEAIVGLSRSSIYELIARKQFPAPIKLGLRSVGWLRHEVVAWVEAQVAATRTVAA